MKDGYPLKLDINFYYDLSLSTDNKKIHGLKSLRSYINSKFAKKIILEQGFTPITKDLESIEAKQYEPVRVGFIANFGSNKSYIPHHVNTVIKIAVAEINKAGGILGKPITILKCNDKSLPQKTSKCMEKLIAKNIDAVIGPLPSRNAILASQILKNHNILQIAPTSIHPDLTRNNKDHGVVLRINKIDSSYINHIFKLIESFPDVKKVLIVRDQGISSIDIANQLQDKLNKHSREILTQVEQINSAENINVQKRYDFLNHKNFDALVLIGPMVNPVKVLFSLALSNRKNIKVIASSDLLLSPEAINKAKLTAEEVYFMGSNKLLSEDNYILELAKKLRKRGTELNTISINSYISVYAMAHMLEKYYLQKKQVKISNIVKSNNKFQTHSMNFNFDKNGNLIGDFISTYQIKNQKIIHPFIDEHINL